MPEAEFPPVEVFSNQDVQAAWRYHQGTNHTYQSVYQNSHHMDLDNQPIPFKIYTTLKSFQLPADLSATGMTAFEALAEPGQPGHVIPTAHDLAALLYYSAGVIRTGDLPGGGKMYFRASSTPTSTSLPPASTTTRWGRSSRNWSASSTKTTTNKPASTGRRALGGRR